MPQLWGIMWYLGITVYHLISAHTIEEKMDHRGKYVF